MMGLAASATPGAAVMVPLAAIVQDRNLWPRRALDAERVKEFAELYAGDDPDALPPVQLAPLPAAGGYSRTSGKSGAGAGAASRYAIVDGWHRIEGRRLAAEKARKADAPAIPAIIRADLTTADAIYLEAVRLSSTSAKPLSSAEKRAAVRRILATQSSLSDREIARLAGCSHMTVGRLRNPLRRSLSAVGDALAGSGAEQGASTGARAERYIEDRLISLLCREDAGELDAADLAAALDGDADLSAMAMHWARMLYQAVTVKPTPAAS